MGQLYYYFSQELRYSIKLVNSTSLYYKTSFLVSVSRSQHKTDGDVDKTNICVQYMKTELQKTTNCSKKTFGE